MQSKEQGSHDKLMQESTWECVQVPFGHLEKSDKLQRRKKTMPTNSRPTALDNHIGIVHLFTYSSPPTMKLIKPPISQSKPFLQVQIHTHLTNETQSQSSQTLGNVLPNSTDKDSIKISIEFPLRSVDPRGRCKKYLIRVSSIVKIQAPKVWSRSTSWATHKCALKL